VPNTRALKYFTQMASCKTTLALQQELPNIIIAASNGMQSTEVTAHNTRDIVNVTFN